MLLEYGTCTVRPEWVVTENTPTGYSRFYYVFSGDVIYTDDACTTRLKSGYLYIFPSSAPYQMAQNPQNPLCCLYLHLDLFPILVTDFISIDVNEFPFLKGFLDTLNLAVMKEGIKIIYSMVDTLYLYCLGHKIISHPDTCISGTLLYIAEHMKEDITIKKLSKLAGYNQQYFIRLFKQNTGVSPYQYIISYRLQESVKLLKKGYSITEAAQMTGYKDLKSLSRAFKSKFGMPPKLWREKYTLTP